MKTLNIPRVETGPSRTEDEWFEIITGFPRLTDPAQQGLFQEHCPNCKDPITKTNRALFTDHTVCEHCK